jgi:hypothetical protein
VRKGQQKDLLPPDQIQGDHNQNGQKLKDPNLKGQNKYLPEIRRKKMKKLLFP